MNKAHKTIFHVLQEMLLISLVSTLDHVQFVDEERVFCDLQMKKGLLILNQKSFVIVLYGLLSFHNILPRILFLILILFYTHALHMGQIL